MSGEGEDGARIADLVRILAKVAGGDFSEKPEIVERQDALSQFTLAVRFMIDDLEASRADESRRREALEEANARLRELSAMKTRFLHSAAHELNTPLTPIRVQIHMFQGGMLGGLNDKQRRAVDVLARNLERLSLLVTDLLDASRLQSDQLRLAKRPAHLDALVEDCVQSFLPQARAAGVALDAAAPRGVGLTVDPQRVTQVLFNLVSNALKFTPREGRIVIETEVSEAEVLVRVRDSGAGLSPAQVERLFRPFSQVHDAMTAVRGGTGLGLYISKGIVEQHGGRIWCESGGPGHGATFAFSLPRGPPSPLPAPSPEVAIPAAGPLVVDPTFKPATRP